MSHRSESHVCYDLAFAFAFGRGALTTIGSKLIGIAGRTFVCPLTMLNGDATRGACPPAPAIARGRKGDAKLASGKFLRFDGNIEWSMSTPGTRAETGRIVVLTK